MVQKNVLNDMYFLCHILHHAALGRWPSRSSLGRRETVTLIVPRCSTTILALGRILFLLCCVLRCTCLLHVDVVHFNSGIV